MLPADFVLLDALPLTPNGKLDYRALPAPNQERPALEIAYVPPHTPTETVLTAIWMDVLDLDRIGIHDNFFELRGHSLLAVQVIARLEEIFPVAVPLRQIFDTPTVAQLAQQIEALCAEAQVDAGAVAQLFIDLNELSDAEIHQMLDDRDGA